MSKTINLLPPQKRSTLRNNKIVRWLRFIAICNLSLVFLLALGLFSYTAFSPLPSLQEEQQTLSATLNQQQGKIVTLLHTKARLQEIAAIISKRAPLDTTLGVLLETAGDDVTITAVQLDKENIQIAVQSQTLRSLDAFLANISSQQILTEDYTNILLESMYYDNKSNIYSARIILSHE